MLLRYWSKPGDLGRIVGAFSTVFGNRQGELADLLAPILCEGPRVPKKSIRTVGTYYQAYSNGGIQRTLSMTLPVWLRLGYRVVFLTDEENENDFVLPKGVVRVICAVSNGDGAKDYSARGEDWENLLRKYEIDVMVYHNVYGASQLWDTLLCRLMGISILTFYHSALPAGQSIHRRADSRSGTTEFRCDYPERNGPYFLALRRAGYENPADETPADL